MFLGIVLALGSIAIGSMIAANLAQNQPQTETQDQDSPTAEEDVGLGVLFGDMTIKGVNIIYFTDKNRAEVKL
jgi:hypothetical protein